MRLDHLLSKEEEVEEREALFNYEGSWSASEKMCERKLKRISGGDASGGHTRSHPEHDG